MVTDLDGLGRGGDVRRGRRGRCCGRASCCRGRYDSRADRCIDGDLPLFGDSLSRGGDIRRGRRGRFDGHTDGRIDGSLALFGDGLSLLNELLAEYIFGRVDGRIDCGIDGLTHLVLGGIDGLTHLVLHRLDSIADSIADSIGGRVDGSSALLLDCVGRGAHVLRSRRLGLHERRT